MTGIRIKSNWKSNSVKFQDDSCVADAEINLSGMEEDQKVTGNRDSLR